MMIKRTFSLSGFTKDPDYEKDPEPELEMVEMTGKRSRERKNRKDRQLNNRKRGYIVKLQEIVKPLLIVSMASFYFSVVPRRARSNQLVVNVIMVAKHIINMIPTALVYR